MKKTFDCVQMTRDIREKLSSRYAGNQDLEMQELRQARERFEKKALSKPVRLAEEAGDYRK